MILVCWQPVIQLETEAEKIVKERKLISTPGSRREPGTPMRTVLQIVG